MSRSFVRELFFSLGLDLTGCCCLFLTTASECLSSTVNPRDTSLSLCSYILRRSSAESNESGGKERETQSVFRWLRRFVSSLENKENYVSLNIIRILFKRDNYILVTLLEKRLNQVTQLKQLLFFGGFVSCCQIFYGCKATLKLTFGCAGLWRGPGRAPEGALGFRGNAAEGPYSKSVRPPAAHTSSSSSVVFR